MKVLDVGCGFGDYLQFFGPGSMGIDIRTDRVTEAIRRGFHAIEGDIEGSEHILPQNYFDAAWMAGVLEHVQSPHKTLLSAKSTLKEGGLLFLSVPLIPNTFFGLTYKILTRRKRFGYEAATHLYAFNRKSAEFTVERAGLEVIETSTFFPPNALHRIFDFFFKDMVPTITIVARKK